MGEDMQKGEETRCLQFSSSLFYVLFFLLLPGPIRITFCHCNCQALSLGLKKKLAFDLFVCRSSVTRQQDIAEALGSSAMQIPRVRSSPSTP